MRIEIFSYCNGLLRDFYENYAIIQSKEAYATIKVYKGDAVVTGVFVDGVPVEDYIENISFDVTK